LTSISRARSLIRTLLIRLFSESARPLHLVAHSYLVARDIFVIAQLAFKAAAHLTRRPRQPPSLPLRFRFRVRQAPQLLRCR
jgi:hypothetical protein